MKFRDDKYSRTAGRALLIDGGYFPGQLGLESGVLNLLFSYSQTCEVLSLERPGDL